MKKLILFFAITCNLNFTNAQWQQTNGPYGGTITCFATNGSNIFAGTYNGGVFLSTNNGLNWTPVNTGLPNIYINYHCCPTKICLQ